MQFLRELLIRFIETKTKWQMRSLTTVLYMGDWTAIRHEQPACDGKCQLISISDDPTETTVAADQHPDVIKKLTFA